MRFKGNEMPISIAVCDDEKNIRDNIKSIVLKQYTDCLVDLYDSGNSLFAAGKEYDIYLLDIQMPGINGMETAEQIRKRRTTKSWNGSVIIFITSFKEYMADAFDVRAFHYLLKPIDESKFQNVFSRAVSDCLSAKEKAETHILIKSKDSYHKVLLSDIYYVESDNKKVIVHTMEGAIEYYGKMQDLEISLGNDFFRSHRCFIVNLEHITRYNASTIRMKNGSDVLLAQKKYNEFVKTYLHFAKSGGLIHG